MKFKLLVFLVSFFTGYVYACDNGKINDLIKISHGRLIQVLNSDYLYSGSSIFFYYLSDNDEHPDLKASFTPNRCIPQRNVTFDSFSYDGSGANVVSVFWGKGGYKNNLFIIVSWVYNLDGINTVGEYYNVYAYDYNKGNIVRNDKITELFEGGRDGVVDGKSVKYKFKTAGDVWAYLKRSPIF